jgi:hypothetical protein
MVFIPVPTDFVVYIVLDKEAGTLKLVKECKTKGEVVEWIYESGDKDIIYCIKEHLRKK